MTTDLKTVLTALLERPLAHLANEEELAAYERTKAEVTEREARERRRRYEALIAESGIPLEDGVIQRLGRKAGANPPPLESWESRRAAQSFALGPSRFLALLGGTGTGKTTAAAAAAFARLGSKSKPGVVYVRERQLERWQSFARYETEWRAAISCATLIVDEIGTASDRIRANARMALLEVCDARMAGDRKTVVIGNLEPDAFARYIDPRLLSRWHACGHVVWINGEDRRLARRVGA